MFNKEQKKELLEMSNSTNSIAKGTIISGDIESYGNIRIEGVVNGDIKTKSKLVLGDSAKVNGSVLAQNAEISGEITGTIEISDQLNLKPTAVINGDITTNKLVVESGAQFNGNCKMGAIVKEIMLGNKNQLSQKEKTA